MSVINNKGFTDYGVSSLQVAERFPIAVARDSFDSEVYVKQKSVEHVEDTPVYNLTYTLVHMITYRPITEVSPRTVNKSYTITIPVRVTNYNPDTEPKFTTRLSYGKETFTNSLGFCPDATFHKYTRYITFEVGEDSVFPKDNTTPPADNSGENQGS